ncbi:MAG: RHS repeat-associated core domain-containing protein [Coriobacteriia bacterium]|jgi:RHS repeat-associated protein|nr:RHS repeat-associated core domain-containing protein [Coriobacteriia bacterium]
MIHRCPRSLDTLHARYAYDPYGAVLSQASNAVTGISAALASAIAARQPLRFAGYVYDAHSATYYLSARHYDPATMRFLSKDPARDDGEESAYQYCAGDPVGKVDPSGEKSLWNRFRNQPLDKLYRTYSKFGSWAKTTWSAWSWANKIGALWTIAQAAANGERRGLRIYDVYRRKWPQELRDIYLPLVMSSSKAKTVNLVTGVTKNQKWNVAKATPEYKKRAVKKAGYLVVRGVEVVW